MSNYTGEERREFLRYDYEKPLRYSIVSSPKGKNPIAGFIKTVSKNLSVSGILFTAEKAPAISSLLILDLDYRTVNICKEIESRAVIVNNRLLGKVVRIDENNEGLCDIGVVFVTKSDRIPEDIIKVIG